METLDYTPNEMPLKLYGGDDSPIDFYLKSSGVAVNITGWKCRVQFRQQPMAANVVADFEGTIIDAPSGQVRVVFTGAKTRQLVAITTIWIGVYDVQFTDSGGSITTPIYGQVTVFKDVTR